MSETSVTLQELRELSKRSRRVAGWGTVALAGTLVLFPVLALVASLAPAWYGYATYAALALGGALLLRFAFIAGQERGEYRKVFRRARESARTRSVPVEGAPSAAAAAAEAPVAAVLTRE